jgi:hypothetical protein
VEGTRKQKQQRSELQKVFNITFIDGRFPLLQASAVDKLCQLLSFCKHLNHSCGMFKVRDGYPEFVASGGRTVTASVVWWSEFDFRRYGIFLD